MVSDRSRSLSEGEPEVIGPPMIALTVDDRLALER
jgi:hypothetical protein